MDTKHDRSSGTEFCHHQWLIRLRRQSAQRLRVKIVPKRKLPTHSEDMKQLFHIRRASDSEPQIGSGADTVCVDVIDQLRDGLGRAGEYVLGSDLS